MKVSIVLYYGSRAVLETNVLATLLPSIELSAADVQLFVFAPDAAVRPIEEALFPYDGVKRRIICDEYSASVQAAHHAPGRINSADYVIFLDAGLEISADWLGGYLASIKKYGYSNLFAGPVRAKLEAGTPGWILRNIYSFREPYGVVLSDSPSPTNGNLAVRACLLEQWRSDATAAIDARGAPSWWSYGGRFPALAQATHLDVGGHNVQWVEAASTTRKVAAESLNYRYLWTWYEAAGRAFAEVVASDARLADQRGKALWKHLVNTEVYDQLFTGSALVRLVKMAPFAKGILEFSKSNAASTMGSKQTPGHGHSIIEDTICREEISNLGNAQTDCLGDTPHAEDGEDRLKPETPANQVTFARELAEFLG